MFPSVSPKQSFLALEKFDEWNEEKKNIQQKNTHEVYINPRDIWYVKMGINTNGKSEFIRPVLVFKRVGNLLFVAPLTTKGKDSNFYHLLSTIKYLDTQYAREASYVELSQSRVIDRKRFLDKVGTIESAEFWDIKNKLIKLLL
jgi:mRNA-degrading endonuclease toxin of MazEF toxin-antitoxin module